METRTMEVTLEKAREWYDREGEFRRMALELFDESQLNVQLEEPESLEYNDIAKEMFSDGFFQIKANGDVEYQCFGATGGKYKKPTIAKKKHQLEKLIAINKLANVAKYLNNGWEPNWHDCDEPKYYFSFVADPIYNDPSIDVIYTFKRMDVYFRTEKLARRALDILGEDTIRLAVESNW